MLRMAYSRIGNAMYGGIMSNLNEVMMYLTMECCFTALILMMACRMNASIGNTDEVRVFRGLAGSALMQMAADSIWALDCLSVIQLPVPAAYLYNMASLLGADAIGWLWYRFLDVKSAERAELMKRKFWYQIWMDLPFAFPVFLICTSPATHLIFYVTQDGGYHRGPWYAAQIACGGLYLLASLARQLIRLIRCPGSRAQTRSFIISTLVLGTGGVLQVFRAGIPFTEVSYTLGMFFLFVELQSRQINTDALTGLNNRAKARSSLDSRIARAGKEPLCLGMADIDQFKSINDRYGHLSGDEALVLVANTFRDLGGYYRTLFLSRYGGDEFLFFYSAEEGDPDRLRERFDLLLAENLNDSLLPFRFTVSIGEAVTADPDIGREALIAEADSMLYANKREKESAYAEMQEKLPTSGHSENGKREIPKYG